ncbi:MAG: S8 family serine peptidase [Phycisphaeraceae bacterium]|nr:S8 family serine peptidase [Phycisphaeraceae bacterium]
MRRMILGGIAVMMAAPCMAADIGKGPGQVFVARPGDRELSGRLIARPFQAAHWLEQGLTQEQFSARIAAARQSMAPFQLKDYVAQTDEYVFNVPAGQSEGAIAAQLLATGNFQYVEPDWIVYPVGCPDDTQLSQQWHHNANRVNSCAGWDVHTGSPSVTVGICDTGIRTTHEDFQLHRKEGYNAVDRLWESQGGNINPVHWHGTSTSGCAAANGNNGKGVSGMGWNLSHRMLRVSNSAGGSASLSDLQHAARTSIEAGDRVANVSYGGVDSASTLTTATYIKSIGGLLVWSAGNDGRNLTFGPRDADDLIVVGATTSSDTQASFSADGQFMDLVAPGEGVFSCDADNDSDYAAVSGTSFSAPLTAGVIAMIWSYNPSLTPDEVEAILKAGCDDLGATGVDNTFGYGRIDLANSLALATKPLEFVYPGGLPDTLDPNGGTTVRVEVLAGDANPIPGTGMLHYNDGGGWNAIAMDVVSANVYDAVFPSLPCPQAVQFLPHLRQRPGHPERPSRRSPPPPMTPSVGGVATIADFNFETALGMDRPEWIVAHRRPAGDPDSPAGGVSTGTHRSAPRSGPCLPSAG